MSLSVVEGQFNNTVDMTRVLDLCLITKVALLSITWLQETKEGEWLVLIIILLNHVAEQRKADVCLTDPLQDWLCTSNIKYKLCSTKITLLGAWTSIRMKIQDGIYPVGGEKMIQQSNFLLLLWRCSWKDGTLR